MLFAYLHALRYSCGTMFFLEFHISSPRASEGGARVTRVTREKGPRSRCLPASLFLKAHEIIKEKRKFAVNLVELVEVDRLGVVGLPNLLRETLPELWHMKVKQFRPYQPNCT
eukprot:1158193-Pelagomonas_calceolata.AAC.9